jgi:hypothetical protein
VIEMDTTVQIIAALGAIFLAFFMGRGGCAKKKTKKPDAPPKNTVADAARDNIQQTFEEEIDRVTDALSEANTAAQLAALGNARKRSPKE